MGLELAPPPSSPVRSAACSAVTATRRKCRAPLGHGRHLHRMPAPEGRVHLPVPLLGHRPCPMTTSLPARSGAACPSARWMRA
jgi:hypothetical protein